MKAPTIKRNEKEVIIMCDSEKDAVICENAINKMFSSAVVKMMVKSQLKKLSKKR